MKTLTVALPGREYNIQIGWGLLTRAGEELRAVLPGASRIFVVTDSHVAPLYLERVRASLEGAGFRVTAHTVPAGEGSKCPARLAELWEAMMDAGLTRTDAVAALGGGVVGDLAGFAAATILRGVDFVQIPTTLLAQVDSSVGGKTGVDIPQGKNLVGAFWQPVRVIADPDTLESLSPAVFADGMAEIIKAACIKDADFFSRLESGEAVRPEQLEQTILQAIDIKRGVVERDENETGERKLLNFGHTMGHALEKYYDYSALSHGRAVALGMVLITEASQRQGLTEKGTVERICAVLERHGLPIADTATLDDYLPGVALDKKRSGTDIDLALLRRIGEGFLYRMPVALLGGFLRGEEL